MKPKYLGVKKNIGGDVHALFYIPDVLSPFAQLFPWLISADDIKIEKQDIPMAYQRYADCDQDLYWLPTAEFFNVWLKEHREFI
jgi:hypothetical protein